MKDRDDAPEPPIDEQAIDPAELTLEADPVWLDEIRSGADDAVADPELTIDASPELVDVIRSEIARRDAAVGGTSPDPDVAAPSPPSPPSPPSSPVASGRWQPQQRLAARAPVTATTPIVRTDHHRTKDSTKIILAAIAATAVVVVAWLLVGGETADAPPSLDTSTTVDGTQPSASTTPAGTEP